MPIAQSPSPPWPQRLHAMVRRWQRLLQTACNPYRPELHYMRGPGPKWHARRRNHGR